MSRQRAAFVPEAGMACRRDGRHSPSRSAVPDPRRRSALHCPSHAENDRSPRQPGGTAHVTDALTDRRRTGRARRFIETFRGVRIVRVMGIALPTILVLLMLLAGPVSGHEYREKEPRLYLSAGGALVLPDDARGSGHDIATGQPVGADVSFDAGHGLVLVMGYGEKTGGVRGELEFGYRTFSIDKISNPRVGDRALPGPFEAGGDVTAFSLMGNVVSSLPLGPVNFYLGGGSESPEWKLNGAPLRAYPSRKWITATTCSPGSCSPASSTICPTTSPQHSAIATSRPRAHGSAVPAPRPSPTASS